MSGRGIHKRRKKSIRSHLEHRKMNSVRRQQLKQKDHQRTLPLVVSIPCSIFADSLIPHIGRSTLSSSDTFTETAIPTSPLVPSSSFPNHTTPEPPIETSSLPGNTNTTLPTMSASSITLPNVKAPNFCNEATILSPSTPPSVSPNTSIQSAASPPSITSNSITLPNVKASNFCNEATILSPSTPPSVSPSTSIQSAASPPSITSEPLERIHPCADFTEIMNLPLPGSSWKSFSEGDKFVQLSKFELNSGQFIANVSIKVLPDLQWKVYLGESLVPDTCKMLETFQCAPTSVRQIRELIECLDSAIPCPGNPDSDFVDICKEHDGVIRGDRGNGEVIGSINVQTSRTCTVRRKDCDMLINKHSSRCKKCQSLRMTLRSRRSRQNSQTTSTEAKVSISSHCKYSALTSSEKTTRLRNLQNSVKVTRLQLLRMQNKAISTLQADSLQLHPKDSNDISTIFNQLTNTVHQQFPRESPQRIFWDQQQKYNSLKDKRQMKWHPLIIRFALNLKYSSTSAYHAVQQSGLISLPSERTLFDYTHWMTPHSGLQLDFVEEFHRRVDREVSSGQFHCALSLDEMKIKSGLVFDKHKGRLIGFIDLGSVNSDINKMMSVSEEETEVLADHVLVVMARAVFKPSLAVPIAHYFSHNLTAEKIFPIVWEALETLELYNIPVVSITSDGAKPNRRFYQLCSNSSHKGHNVPYKTCNPLRKNADVFFFCDAPHLLKTTRNCFSNSFAHSKSRKMQKCGQEISWKWIESLYLTETSTSFPGVRLCHKLTREHVWLNSFSRMRVHLAAEVMSESVASALQFLANDRTIQTRVFIRMIDRFFDYLNVKSSMLADLKRKESVSPYRSIKDERFKWLSEDFLSYLEEWENEGKAMNKLSSKERQKMCLSRETLEGLRITVKSFTELGKILLKLPQVDYLLSEVFSQDPLERYFSRQRHRGGSCDNPTAYQVPYTAVTLLQQQAIYKDLKTMNVEARNEEDHILASQPLRKRPRRI